MDFARLLRTSAMQSSLPPTFARIAIRMTMYAHERAARTSLAEKSIASFAW
jgi:UDP-N-acetylglucosamine:LPS N-acetylglucosamine transferase